MNTKILSAIVLTTILSCNTAKKTAQKQEQVVEKEVLPEVTIQSLGIEEGDNERIKSIAPYQASNTRVNDLLHTKLKVKFDWEKQHLIGEATLDFKPYFYPTKTLTLDAKGFDLRAVQLVKNGKKTDLKYSYDGFKIVINLDKEYTRNEEYTVYIDYTAKPNELKAGGSHAITSDKGLYFINPLGEDPNKMPQIWTQGETEASSCWFPTIDSPNEKTTEEIYITVKDKYKTLSNGTLISSTKNPDGTRTDYWKQDQKHAPYLFMMGIGEFKVITDSWTKKDGSKLLVDYYVEEEYAPYAKAIFGKTPKMLTAFSDMLGIEYPWDKYSQIVVRDYVSGAMENTTAVIHGDFLYRTDRELLDAHNEAIIAHELFHHWFGDLVTCESWANLPMNEAFANYSQFLWDEYEHGAMEADRNAYGEMNGYKLSSVQGGYHDLIWFDYDEREQMFDGHSYNKGGRILHMLRKYIGDEAFFLSLKDYLTKRMYNTGEAHDLRLSLEEVTGEDLNWFFNQWFFDKGHPDVVITQSYDEANGELTVSLEQKQNFEQMPLFKLPIDIDIYTANGKVRERVWMTKSKQNFVFKTAKPLLVNVDAEKILLWDKEDDKPLEQWVYQLNNAPLYVDKKEAFAKLKSSNDKEAQKAILAMLDHPYYDIKNMAMKSLSKVRKTFPAEVKTKLLALTTDKKSSVRANALRFLEKYYKNDKETKDAIAKAVNDPSYKVMGRALKGLVKTDEAKALAMAKDLEKENNPTVNGVIAGVYAKAGGPEQHDFFVNAIKSASGIGKFGVLNNYKSYIRNQDDKEIEKSLDIYKDVAENGGMWFVKMQGYQSLFSAEEKLSYRINELSTEIDNTSDAMRKAELERDMNELKNVKDKAEAYVDTLKKNEKDERILEFLNKK